MLRKFDAEDLFTHLHEGIRLAKANGAKVTAATSD